MGTLKLQNGVSLTLPKGWVLKGRYGSQPGRDYTIILQNKASILHVYQHTTDGRTLNSSKKGGLNRHGDVVLTKDSCGCTLESKI